MKILKNYKELSSTVADIVKRQLKKQPLSKLVLPTGDTPLGMYDELVKRELDWSHAITFNLDVYLMNVDHPESYQSYMRKNLFEKTNIYPDHCHFPFRPTSAFEDKIAGSMGIDLCILGIGTNGHIAFNEPGSHKYSATRIVDLTENTIKDNSRFFDNIDEVPTQAYTMGMSSIMGAEKIYLVAQGKHKKDILEKAMYGDITPEVPASFLQEHDNLGVYYSD